MPSDSLWLPADAYQPIYTWEGERSVLCRRRTLCLCTPGLPAPNLDRLTGMCCCQLACAFVALDASLVQ